jgi:hypothetical protein
MNQHGVDFMLIGGMNFLLRHEPILTFDVDLWIEDSDENRRRCENALAALDAEWGATDKTFELVRNKSSGWLDQQQVFSLHSPHGSIDLFRSVQGMPDWSIARQRAIAEKTSTGVDYYGISDEDMLTCQLALDASLQKSTRIQKLKATLGLP